MTFELSYREQKAANKECNPAGKMGVLSYYVTLFFLEPKGPDHSNHQFPPCAHVGTEPQKERQ